jgi:hypothetical protein
MTGPENYREATVITENARCDYGCPHAGCPHEMAYLARAQVHATLALTAAVVAGSASVIRPSDRDRWQEAIDTPPSGDITDHPYDGPPCAICGYLSSGHHAEREVTR